MAKKIIDITKPPTEEQVKMLERAKALPLPPIEAAGQTLSIPADAEYQEFSAEELKQFKRISNNRRSERNKQKVCP